MENGPKRYTQDILSCAIAQKLSQSKRLGGEVQWYILRYTRQGWAYLSITQYISVYIGLSLWRRSHPGTYPGTFTERYNMIYFYIKRIYWDILSSTRYILRCAPAYQHKLYGLVYTKIYLVQPSINWDIPWLRHTTHRPGYKTGFRGQIHRLLSRLPVPVQKKTRIMTHWHAEAIEGRFLPNMTEEEQKRFTPSELVLYKHALGYKWMLSL